MRSSTFQLGLTVMIVAVFYNLKLHFLSRKDFFNSKGVGLGKESSNKNIDYSFENYLALICTLIPLVLYSSHKIRNSSSVIEPSAKEMTSEFCT